VPGSVASVCPTLCPEPINSPAQIGQLAFALQQRVRIATVRHSLFFGETIEFLEQSQYFRLAIVGHRDGIPRVCRGGHTGPADTVAPPALLNPAPTNGCVDTVFGVKCDAIPNEREKMGETQSGCADRRTL